MDVATFKRHDVETSRRLNVTTLKRRDVSAQRRDITEKASKNFVHIEVPMFKKLSPLGNVTLWTCNVLQKRILPSTCVRES